MMLTKEVPDEALALWLSTKESVDLKSSEGKMLSQFMADHLKVALQDRTGTKAKPITMKWYVDELMSMYRTGNSSAAVKLEILRELKRLMKLAALQEKKLAKDLQAGDSPTASITFSDPMVPSLPNSLKVS